jgi:hypothetical protein
MVYSLRGMMVAMVGVAAVGVWTAADRSANWQQASATVFRIDRSCKFTNKYEDGRTGSTTEDCNATDEFEQVKKNRSKVVDGTAVVKVSYTAPQDNSYQTSELKFTGRDDQFYKLKAGDTVSILVHNEDRTRIRLD